MSLDTMISKELMGAISRSYESELYTAAVLDALHFLSDTIREKAEVDGDGAALAGQAFSGDSPKLRLNKLQTQSEKDEQKGFEQLVRGLYQGIRNPRSHERIEDKRNAADAIIVFINFVLETISKARPLFTIDEWLELVFDPLFVSDDHDYAKLVVAQVPAKKRFDALINVYRRKDVGNLKNLAQVIKEMTVLLDENQLGDFLKEVSLELRTVRNRTEQSYDGFGNIVTNTQDAEDLIRTILCILPSNVWPKIDKIAKKRIENKLIQSIEKGEYDTNSKKCTSGSLGTWARDLVAHFEDENKLRLYTIFIKKLRGDQSHREYVIKFFSSQLPDTLAGDEDDGNRKMGYFDAIYDMLSKTQDQRTLLRKVLTLRLFSDEWLQELRKKLINPDYEPDRRVFGLPEILDEDIPF